MLIVLLAFFGVWFITKCGSNTLSPPRLLYIPKGDLGRISKAFQDQGVDISMSKLVELTGHKPIKSGWVRFAEGSLIKYEEFAKKLLDPQREKTRRVVMYSGDTIHMFVQKLSSQTKLPKEELLNAYYRRSPYSDGGILAGYYRLPYRLTPDAAMYYMTKSSTNIFKKISAKYGIRYTPIEFKKYLIIASIIQKETWHTEEMPLISSVINNRLQKGIKLQIDATLNYGPYAHTPVTPKRIREDDSRFNTYKYKGLPPEPIGSVSKEAIEAAIHPASSKYLFFVRNTKGTHTFSKTYQEHLGTIKDIIRKKQIDLALKQNITSGSTPIEIIKSIKDNNLSTNNSPSAKDQ